MGTGVWGPGQEGVALSRSPGARRVLGPRPPHSTCRWSPAGMQGGPWGARLGLLAERASVAAGRAHRSLSPSCSSCRFMSRPQNALKAGLTPRAFHQLLECSQLSCPCSAAQRCPTLCHPWTAARQAPLPSAVPRSLPMLTSTELMPPPRLAVCRCSSSDTGVFTHLPRG